MTISSTNASVWAVLLAFHAAAVVAPSHASDAAGAPVTLVRDGEPMLPIVTGVDAATAPAERLRTYLEHISGARLEIISADHNGPGVYVGLFEDFPELAPDAAGRTADEGFILRSDGQSLYILADAPLGVERGVTTLLHELGCRWFFPGDVWEVVPERDTITGGWNELQQPDFHIYRRIWYGFGTFGPCAADLRQWVDRNRMGGPTPITLSHSWYGLDREADFERNPEWFALVDGERRPSKPCYSHPAVIERMIQSAREQAERGRPMVGVGAPDGLNFCECDDCRDVFQGGEPYEAHRTLFAERPDGKLVNITSETVFAATNEVARVMAEEYPDVMVTQFAYSAYSHPPSFDMEPNVYIQTTTGFRRTPLTLEEQLTAWGERTDNLGIYEYWSVFMWDWDGPSVGSRMHFDTIQRNIQLFADHNVSAMNAESSNNWGPRGLGYYLLANLLWDVDADVRELTRDFYRKAFGPAAVPMQRHYARWYGQDAIVLDEVAERDTWEQGVYARGDLEGTERTLRAMFRDLSEAAELVRDEPGYRERVDHMRMYVYYLYLRFQEFRAAAADDDQAILQAVEDETRWAGRLAHTNLVHARASVSLAFSRRFRAHRDLLEEAGVATGRGETGGYRVIGEPPEHDELNDLWRAARADLGLD